MSFDTFISTWNNKGVDFDGYYGYQCMDLYQMYNRDVVGAPSVPNPAAADVLNNYPKDFYTRLVNSPTNFPQRGDVIIWKKATNLPYGHIAVCVSADANTFTSFDQNWPTGSLCHLQPHNYTNVAGWLRPKLPAQVPSVQVPNTTPVPTPATPVFTDQTLIPIGGTWGDMELQAVRSSLSDLKTSNDALRRSNNDLQTAYDALKNTPIPAPTVNDDGTITHRKLTNPLTAIIHDLLVTNG